MLVWLLIFGYVYFYVCSPKEGNAYRYKVILFVLLVGLIVFMDKDSFFTYIHQVIYIPGEGSKSVVHELEILQMMNTAISVLIVANLMFDEASSRCVDNFVFVTLIVAHYSSI